MQIISSKHKKDESTRYDARLSLIHSCPMLLGYIIFALYLLLLLMLMLLLGMVFALSSSLFFYPHSMISFSHLEFTFGMVLVSFTVCIAHFKFFIYSLTRLSYPTICWNAQTTHRIQQKMNIYRRKISIALSLKSPGEREGDREREGERAAK